MARFIQNGDLLINADFVKFVEKCNDNTLLVTMKDGDCRYLPAELFHDFRGEDIIREIIPIRNAYAVFRNDDGYVREPIPAFAVTESGIMRPIDLDGEHPKFLDEYTDYEGTDFSQMTIERGRHYSEEICE